MRVRVYRNLHKQTWSIVSCRTGRVIDHRPFLALWDCKLVVRPAGREKVIRERRKNVHAFVVGTPLANSVKAEGYVSITYNPYAAPTFTRRDNGEPVTGARAVLLAPDGKAFALLD